MNVVCKTLNIKLEDLFFASRSMCKIVSDNSFFIFLSFQDNGFCTQDLFCLDHVKAKINFFRETRNVRYKNKTSNCFSEQLPVFVTS